MHAPAEPQDALSPTSQRPTGLVDLPVEVLELVVRWVALMRYEYSESRRPKPSPLHHLAHGTNRTLRRIALPYLFRDAWATDAFPDEVWLPGDGPIAPIGFLRVLRHYLCEDTQRSALEMAPRVERLVLTWRTTTFTDTLAPPPPMDRAQASYVNHIELRHATLSTARRETQAYFDNLSNLVSTVNSNLRSLSIATQLDTVLTGEARPMQEIVQATQASFGPIPLESLSIDDFATCTPRDLADLAAAFPTLKTLSLSDRMVWKGSRSDLLAALSPLVALETLSCRLPPDTPASSFDLLTATSSSGVDDDALFASPAAVALEAALHLPRLGLVGFIAQHSDVEWFRVRRDCEGRPQEAEAVRIVDMDLDRP
ncbi:hypothetical protein JCM3770_006911 [Rhodotorula araucariae]